MIIRSISPIGQQVLEQKTAVLIGLSIKNSYFKEENITELISWGSENFEHVFIMLPDVPAISTLKSLGYDEGKARATAMLKCNNLENKCNRIIDSLGVKNVKIIRWKDLEGNEAYATMLEKLTNLYGANDDFKNDVRTTTLGVIEGNGTTLPKEQALDIGVDFILQELACILNSADIFNVPTCAYVYHREMPVHVNMLNNKYPFTPPQNTGYIICETEFSQLRNISK